MKSAAFCMIIIARRPADVPINIMLMDFAFQMGISLKSTRSTGNENDQVIGIDDDKPELLNDTMMVEIDPGIKL